MNEQILELEKCLLRADFLKDTSRLDEIIDDMYLEVGKSGRLFGKADEIRSLSAAAEDRNIVIYNFTCDRLDENIYMAHYITCSGSDQIFRTSIWRRDAGNLRIVFHQASRLSEAVGLTES